MALDDRIEALARARSIQAEYEAELVELNADIEAQFGAALDRIRGLLKTAKEGVELEESAVRRAALNAYGADGNKRPHAAVQVKEYTVLGYDLSDALSYCIKYLTVALKMDRRKFEAIAKVAELDFVSIGTEPRATIARDLSAYSEE